MLRPTFSPVMLLALAALFVLQACASVETLVDQGNYDQVIELAQRRLTGKQRKNPKLVRAVEEAFARVEDRDLREIERLKAGGNEENWGRINSIYRSIRHRQDALRPLLPLTDKNGYTAHFAFADVGTLEQESRERAADFHYGEALDLLGLGRRGDKIAARAAYREFEETQKYFRNYRDSRNLQQLAHELGIVHILVGVTNDAPVVTPTEFERRLQSVNVADLNSFWQRYHLTATPDYAYDFRINLRITDIRVSPDLVREREYTDVREIEDGFDYVLDDNGNVLKDSLGNDVKVPRTVLIKAWVLEVHQQKQADVMAQLEVYDLTRNQLIRTQDLAASAIFENYASTFRGDRRALSSDSRRCIGNSPQPFPPGEAMILQAAEELKPALLDRLVDYQSLVQV